MTMQKVLLIGRLGADPEMRHAPTGAAVCNFTVATSERYKDKQGQSQEKTEWHKIVTFGKIAELCNQYIQKGSQVYIEGKLQTRSWENKDGKKNYITEIIGNVVQFLDSKKSSGNNPEQLASNGVNNVVSGDNFASDDIPF